MKVAVVVVLALVTRTAEASPRDWIGSAACGTCHPKHLAAWQRTPHANTATRSFPHERPTARCLMCHGTGEAPVGPTIAVEVGCEACHGAGKSYAEDDLMRNRSVAVALGMTDVWTPPARAALCATCHIRRTTDRPFDPSAPVHEIAP